MLSRGERGAVLHRAMARQHRSSNSPGSNDVPIAREPIGNWTAAKRLYPTAQKFHSDVALRIQRILTRHFDWDRVRPDHNGCRFGSDKWLEPGVSVAMAGAGG